MSRAWSTPSGRKSRSTTGIFFKPRSFMRVQTSCSSSPGRQNTTSCVIANEAAVTQFAPSQQLIWLTTSVFVMTPAIRPVEPHTITRSVPVCRNFAASASGASSAIVTSFHAAAGNNLSTNIALSLSSFIILMTTIQSLRSIAAGFAAPASLQVFLCVRIVTLDR